MTILGAYTSSYTQRGDGTAEDTNETAEDTNETAAPRGDGYLRTRQLLLARKFEPPQAAATGSVAKATLGRADPCPQPVSPARSCCTYADHARVLALRWCSRSPRRDRAGSIRSLGSSVGVIADAEAILLALDPVPDPGPSPLTETDVEAPLTDGEAVLRIAADHAGTVSPDARHFADFALAIRAQPYAFLTAAAL